MRRVLKIREVEERTGKKKSSIYAAVQQKTFPAPISLGGRSSGWLDTDIEKWFDERVQESKAARDTAE